MVGWSLKIRSCPLPRLIPQVNIGRVKNELLGQKFITIDEKFCNFRRGASRSVIHAPMLIYVKLWLTCTDHITHVDVKCVSTSLIHFVLTDFADYFILDISVFKIIDLRGFLHFKHFSLIKFQIYVFRCW